MNDDDLRLAPAGASDAECAVCLHKTFNRIVSGDGFVPLCSGFCLQAWPRVSALLVAVDTARKTWKAWEGLFDERNRLWREEADRVGAVELLLEANGCDCACDHDAESHDSYCDRCLACRISCAIEP